jgi:hypothetical protein
MKPLRPLTEREKRPSKNSSLSSRIDDRASGASIPNSGYDWTSDISPLDAFMSVKMGTLREFQLYMVW